MDSDGRIDMHVVFLGGDLDVPNALELPQKLSDLFQACKIVDLDPRYRRGSMIRAALG